MITLCVSGGLDSNQRPLAPHTSALPGCATTRMHLLKCGLQIYDLFALVKSSNYRLSITTQFIF